MPPSPPHLQVKLISSQMETEAFTSPWQLGTLGGVVESRW